MPSSKDQPQLGGISRRRAYRAKQLAKRAKSVSAKTLLELLPDSLLVKVSQDTGVDRQVKHLSGRLMVLLLIYGILTSKDQSLRSLENVYNGAAFERFSGKGKHQTRHSSLADRLAHIDLNFFEQLYAAFLERVNSVYGSKLKKTFGWLHRFDSTMVRVSANLAKIGMEVGAKTRQNDSSWKQIKFTIGLQGLIPTSAQVFHEQKYLSEERALLQVIEQAPIAPQDIVVFDMGLKSRKTLQSFSQRGLWFVTRFKGTRYEVVKTHKNIKGRTHGDLKFISDQIVHLYQSGGAPPNKEVEYRLITTECTQGDHAGKTYAFLTNILDLTAFEIADIYLKRWDIELFFRFLKQHVGLQHLIAHNQNAITALFYVRLLSATMLQLFFFLNERRDLGIAKMEFADQLNWEIWVTMAILNGADPKKIDPIGYTTIRLKPKNSS
jgi:hypothetical protein